MSVDFDLALHGPWYAWAMLVLIVVLVVALAYLMSLISGMFDR